MQSIQVEATATVLRATRRAYTTFVPAHMYIPYFCRKTRDLNARKCITKYIKNRKSSQRSKQHTPHNTTTLTHACASAQDCCAPNRRATALEPRPDPLKSTRACPRRPDARFFFSQWGWNGLIALVNASRTPCEGVSREVQHTCCLITAVPLQIASAYPSTLQHEKGAENECCKYMYMYGALNEADDA
jgi:hypothetical protein